MPAHFPAVKCQISTFPHILAESMPYAAVQVPKQVGRMQVDVEKPLGVKFKELGGEYGGVIVTVSRQHTSSVPGLHSMHMHTNLSAHASIRPFSSFCPVLS